MNVEGENQHVKNILLIISYLTICGWAMFVIAGSFLGGVLAGGYFLAIAIYLNPDSYWNY